MSETQDKINALVSKLETLASSQELMSKDIEALRHEILSLQTTSPSPEPAVTAEYEKVDDAEIFEDPVLQSKPLVADQSHEENAGKAKESLRNDQPNIEKYIGENVLSRVGIGITILGVAFGAKYAIDHQLLSPLIRIILGYGLGTSLVVCAAFLRKKYENFSAVLAGGAMAIFYLITFAAYNYFQLYNQAIAFVLMVFITACTVYASLSYNKQVLAQIGLVGAYAVPFLLSDNSGRAWILFTYMVLINAGILFIAIKKYWRSLYYSSFIITWVIFTSWMIGSDISGHKTLALTILTFFFLIFYVTFLARKITHGQRITRTEGAAIVLNAILFYCLGCIVVGDLRGFDATGIFTVVNALVHALVCRFLYKKENGATQFYRVPFLMAIFFTTIFFPIQLNGEIVPLSWIAEAMIFFLIAQRRKVLLLAHASLAVIFLAACACAETWLQSQSFFSGVQNWSSDVAILNMPFLVSIILCGTLFYMWREIRIDDGIELEIGPASYSSFAQTAVPVLFICSAYFTFRTEINNFWGQQHFLNSVPYGTEGRIEVSHYYNKLAVITRIDYSLIFFALLSIYDMRKRKDFFLGVAALLGTFFCLLTFITSGLWAMDYFRSNDSVSNVSVIISYVSYALLAASFYVAHLHVKRCFSKPAVRIALDAVLHSTVLVIASLEITYLLNDVNNEKTYKLALSILWGIYALWLIVLGIWKRLVHIRIFAIILFSITLVKLFLFDLNYLSTLARAGLFILLGLLLLVISFLYLRFRKKIFAED